MKLSVEEAFEILGVTKDSSEPDIKDAYRRLALQTHPDKNRDDPVAHQKFLKVSEAYRRIIDPQQSDELDEDMMGDEDYDEDDYETMFAFRMFERMFSFGTGVGFRGDRRNTCHCWECRNSKNFFIPKPQTKYIPKSQRPKDPKEEAKKLQQQQANKNTNPHEDWLSDEEVKPAASKPKKAASKKSNAKKKNTKKSTDVFSYLKDDKNNDHNPKEERPSEHKRNETPKAHIAVQQGGDSSDSDSDTDDDAITAEEMAARMLGGAAPSAAAAKGSKNKGHDNSHSQANSHATAGNNAQPANRVPAIPPATFKHGSGKGPSHPTAYAAVVASAGPAIAPSLPKQLSKQPPVVKKQPKSSDPGPMLCMPAMATGAGAPKKDKAPQPAPNKYKSQVGSLVEMGFDSNSALKALDQSNGNIEAATNLLLSGGSTPPAQSSGTHQAQSLHVNSLKDMKGKVPPKQQHSTSDNKASTVPISVKVQPIVKPVESEKPMGEVAPALSSGVRGDFPPPLMLGAGFLGDAKPDQTLPPGLGFSQNAPDLNRSSQLTYGQYDTQIQALQGMGFSSTSSLNALEKSSGNLKQAASWLLSQELSDNQSSGMGGPSWMSEPSRLHHAPAGVSASTNSAGPPGLIAPSPKMSSAGDPRPRSRGPATPPPIVTQRQADSELGFDYGPLNDYSSFSLDNNSMSGTSRLLGASPRQQPLTNDTAAPPGLAPPGRPPVIPSSPQNSADYSASLLMPHTGSGLLSQQPSSRMDINLSGAVDEPFMMYGFQDAFRGGLGNSLNSGLGGGLGDGLGGSLNSGMKNDSGLSGSIGNDLMGALGGDSSSHMSGSFGSRHAGSDSGVAPSLPHSQEREDDAEFTGFTESIFNDTFTEAVANAVIGSNSNAMHSSDRDFHFSGQQSDISLGQQSSIESSYGSLLGGAVGAGENGASGGSTFSYASALASPSIASGIALTVPAMNTNIASSMSLSGGVGGSPTSASSGVTSGGYQKGYKSKPCVFFQSPKGCARGDKCTFAHISDNSMAPSSTNKSYYQQKR